VSLSTLLVFPQLFFSSRTFLGTQFVADIPPDITEGP